MKRISNESGACVHWTRAVINEIDRIFRQNTFVLGHNVEWPPRSPDLTPMDFFLWGYLKSKVYITPPQNLVELRERINRECNLLAQQNFIQSSFNAMQRKAQICIDRNGRHVEGF